MYFLCKCSNVSLTKEDNPKWRVVMHKESRSKRVKMESTMEFIRLDPTMLLLLEHPQPMWNMPNLVGDIVFSTSEVAMANESLRT